MGFHMRVYCMTVCRSSVFRKMASGRKGCHKRESRKMDLGKNSRLVCNRRVKDSHNLPVCNSLDSGRYNRRECNKMVRDTNN